MPCPIPEAEVPPPSSELMLISALILAASKGCPKRADRILSDMDKYLLTIIEVQPAIRIRAAKYDAEAQASLRRARAWLVKVSPAIKLVARK